MPELSCFDLFFKLLDASCDVSQFHSIEQELEDFFKEDTLNNQLNRLSATFLAFWNDNLAGYFTLINDSIVAEAVTESDREPSWAYHKYPAINSAWISRHRDFGDSWIPSLVFEIESVIEHCAICIFFTYAPGRACFTDTEQFVPCF